MSESIDPRANRESELAEQSASQGASRTSEGGPAMSDAPTKDDGEHGVIGGRVTGTDEDVLAGLRIDPDDAKDAVEADDRREHPGDRG